MNSSPASTARELASKSSWVASWCSAVFPYRDFVDSTSYRKAMIIAIVGVKALYIVWYYAYGIGLNLGDTASYIDESSAEVYLERTGGIGFAYVATVLYSNPVSRLLVEALTISVMCALVLRLRSDRQAAAVTCLLLLPTNVAFMTVASKELLVFLLLCLVYRASTMIRLPAFVLTVALKPSFLVIMLLPIIRRLGFVSLYLLSVVAVAVLLVPVDRWAAIYRDFYTTNSVHFRAGNLTYSEPGPFPLGPVQRALGLDLGQLEPYGVAIGLMVFAVNALVLTVLASRYGAFTGTLMFAVFMVAVVPYSVHNLGSTARYQAPLACALVLNELIVGPRAGKLTGRARSA